MEVSSALDAPANIEAIPTSAASVMLTGNAGKNLCTDIASSAPAAPPIVNSGASVPPDVPLPSETDQDIYFRMDKDNKIDKGSSPFNKWRIFSYPTPMVSGAK